MDNIHWHGQCSNDWSGEDQNGYLNGIMDYLHKCNIEG
jgi:hypothetical protein